MLGILRQVIEVALTLFKRSMETPTPDERKDELNKSTEVSMERVMELRKQGRHVEAENMMQQLRTRGMRK